MCMCNTVWNSDDYKLLAADLTKLEEVDLALSMCHCNSLLYPTLIVSEVVMTYLPIARCVVVDAKVILLACGQ